jgi:hypothetical protein
MYITDAKCTYFQIYFIVHYDKFYGQGESVLIEKTQKLAIFYFYNFDPKFSFKSIKLVLWNTISNQLEKIK